MVKHHPMEHLRKKMAGGSDELGVEHASQGDLSSQTPIAKIMVFISGIKDIKGICAAALELATHVPVYCEYISGIVITEFQMMRFSW